MAEPPSSASPTFPAGHDLGEYRRRLFGVVAAAVQSADIAEELAQETFVRGLERLETLSEPDKLYAWLRSIAMRLVIDHFRRQKGKREVVVPDIASAQDTVSFDTDSGLDNMIKVESIENLRDALALLSNDERASLCFELDGTSISDLVTVLGRTRQAIHMLRFRAKDKLRQLLGDPE